MAEDSKNQAGPACLRCHRDLSGEKPVRLPDAGTYCAACCESMATESFEMETGEAFVKWIEKHPELVMQHLPMEMAVRRSGFLIPLACMLFGLGLLIYGLVNLTSTNEAPSAQNASMEDAPVGKGAFASQRKILRRPGLGYALVGFSLTALFGWLTLRQGRSYLRAAGFKLSLKDGTFHLVHGRHQETFSVQNVKQACIVRPGTVGATEGALGLSDGRMLTLDTCLTDLHALGVVMDLRFREDFPPSASDLEKERRERLRKIRGLS